MLSGVFNLNFSDFRNFFREVRSKIGLHLLPDFEQYVEASERCLIFDLFYCILLHKCM